MKEHARPCNLERFQHRVFDGVAYRGRSLCTCCGRTIALVMDAGMPVDGTCRRCSGRVVAIAPARPRLFPR